MQDREQIQSNPDAGAGNITPPDLIAVRKFCRDVGVHSCTHWRWVKRGWIAEPLDIAGRKYHPREHIRVFLERAHRGDFAVNLKPPAPTRRI